MRTTEPLEKRQKLRPAKQKYAQIGVDTEKAIERISKIAISLHCWQGDDVGGFEKAGAELSGGGIQATGNYPGKARTIKRAQVRHRKSIKHDSRQTPFESARLLSG